MITETFIPPRPLQTPVLFMVFNRPDTTKEVLQEIRKAKPPRLYVAADGFRKNKSGEEEKVNEVRDLVLANIDWDCEVKTLFREENLGCKYAVSGAISWFFEHEEQGIILEDDCLASQSFFWFCEELLERYKDEKKIWHIGGNNFQNGILRGDADYYFSVYDHVWGWASWRDRWQKMDVELDGFTDSHFLEQVLPSKNTIKYWQKVYKKMKAKLIDTWDYQWTFTIWKNKGLSIIPQKNLVTNIGFGMDATHTVANSPYANLDRSEIIITRHPLTYEPNREADLLTSQQSFNSSKLQKLIRRLNKIIKT